MHKFNLFLLLLSALYSCTNSSNSDNQNNPTAPIATYSINSVEFDSVPSFKFQLDNFTYYNLPYKNLSANSSKSKDSLKTAHTHYKLAQDYLKINIKDSAYYYFNLARKYYINLNQLLSTGHSWYSMAYIQSSIKNYTGSEILTLNAISDYQKTNYNLGLYNCYSQLGYNHYKLGELDKSLEYYLKAASQIPLLKNRKIYIVINNNNLADLYLEKGLYGEAKKLYSKLLDSTISKYNGLDHYTRVLFNLNRSKFLNGNAINVLNNFLAVHKMKDSTQNIPDLILSKIFLSKYYIYKSNNTQAVKYLKDAISLSEANLTNCSDQLLASLKLIADIDETKAPIYLNRYIDLKDSLQTVNRDNRNIFTRIHFGKNQFVIKTEKLTNQQIAIGSIGSLSLLILGLLYYIKRQNAKNNLLAFEEKSQKTNERIYNLLLQRQSKEEEGRLKERNRISEELHNNITTNINKNRLAFEALDFKGDNKDNEKFKLLLNELQEAEKEIVHISQELKDHSFKGNKNFPSLIDALISKHKTFSKHTIELNSDKSIHWNTIEGILKINLYRITQEILTNCHKHAKATEVNINLKKEANSLILTVKDNGVGFNTKKHKTGIGLKNIESRTHKIHGEIEITSSPNKGTLIKITIPHITID